MSDTMIVISGVGLYLVGMLAVGYWASRKVESAEDFVVAGRQLPLWLCSATLMATWLGAGTVMGAAGAAYSGGLLAVIADPFGAALCLFLAGLFFVRMMRRLRLLTLVSFFEGKYGAAAGLIASLAMVAVYMGWTGSQLVAFGFVLHTLAGVGTSNGIVIATVIVLAYTTAGGMWAVSLTDFVQLVILIAGFALILPLVLTDAGGWSSIAAALPAGTFRMTPAEPGLAAWLNYLRAWSVIGLGNIAAQDLMQRSLSSRNERVAQNSCYIAGVGYLTIGMIPVLLGIIGAVVLPGLEDPEFVVPKLALQHLPAIPLAIFIGALLSAIMSSADSALLAPASIIGENLFPALVPGATQRQVLGVTRWAVPVVGAASLFIALWAHNIYNLFLDSFSVLLVSLLVPLTAGIWWRKANRSGALASIVCGLVVLIGAAPLWPELPSDILGLGASAVVMVVVSVATQDTDPPLPLRDATGEIVALRQRLGILGPFSGPPAAAGGAATDPPRG